MGIAGHDYYCIIYYAPSVSYIISRTRWAQVAAFVKASNALVNNEAARLAAGGLRDSAPRGGVFISNHHWILTEFILIFHREIYCFMTTISKIKFNTVYAVNTMHPPLQANQPRTFIPRIGTDIHVRTRSTA